MEARAQVLLDLGEGLGQASVVLVDLVQALGQRLEVSGQGVEPVAQELVVELELLDAAGELGPLVGARAAGQGRDCHGEGYQEQWTFHR